MDKIKQFFSDVWVKVAVLVGAVVAILMYIIDLKNQKNAGLQAQVDNIDTQKKADVLEAQINEKLADASATQKEIDAHQAAAAQLADKRKELDAVQQNTTPQQNVDYWNNQK